MANLYILRTLIVNRGDRDEAIINETEIPNINAPIVILGDPGLGKTELTIRLEKQFGFKRVSAGAFYRNKNIARYSTASDQKLIVDGLDEIASSSGTSPIDEVLKKLSEIGNPNFILSCRSADWQGSADRYKINEDYGVEPATLHLQPFTYEDATTFLNSYDTTVDKDAVLRQLDEQDLSEFYINPLTLRLVAEIVRAGQGLPKGRADLFDRASELLTFEESPLHQRSSTAQSNLGSLLDSAGAIFASLLLSGSIGLTDRPRNQVPEGYVHVGELSDVPDAPLIFEAVKTRLFQSPDENLYIPFHRVIAEFLGARWLSKRLSNGLSERRVFQALTFNGGVPTAFRGLHAWLAHFSPRLAERCIRLDPYGVLRYGEPNRLPIDQARLLLSSLASLADEDPHFRSEDWGRRAISGLAREELRHEVIAIITEQTRHVHLSMLVLEALHGSPLTNAIAQELLTIVKNSGAAYAERSHAAEALVGSSAQIDWPVLTEMLQGRSEPGDDRLTLDIIAFVNGAGFSGRQLASAILNYERAFKRSEESDDETDEDPYVSGMTYGISKVISPKLSGTVLDEIAQQLKEANKAADWRPGYELSSAINQLIERAIQDSDVPSPERVWSWLKLTEIEYSSDRKQPVSDWLERNPDLRRKIQRNVINASNGSDGPWIAIVHDLPIVNPALALSTADIADLLIEISSKAALTDFDVALWTDLIRSQRSSDGFPEDVRSAASQGIEQHSILSTRWEQIIAPPKRDLQKEEHDRRTQHEKERAQRFAGHRATFLPRISEIASGDDIGSLSQIAKAYLGRFMDLNSSISPESRVRTWLGKDLTEAALTGFVATLARSDIPSAKEIAELRVEGKYWRVELVIICGIAELVRLGKPLARLPEPIAGAALAAWWEFSDLNSKRLGEQIQGQLEDRVLSSDESIRAFLVSVIEPYIRAGHQHVPGLYRIAREHRFSPVIGKLSLEWLDKYPATSVSTQTTLTRIVIEHGLRNDLRNLVRVRLANLDTLDPTIQRVWISAAFIVDFENDKYVPYFDNDKSYLWNVAELLGRLDDDARPGSVLATEQREFIVRTFGSTWPLVSRPSTSSGRTNPWDASNFIRANIDALGANPSVQASESLARLMHEPNISPYHDQIKHVRAQQFRLRRDTEFRIPRFEQIKEMLAGRLPAGIDDLKAILLDRLEAVQDYIRNGDTGAWEAFWTDNRPKDENTCRNRLLDQIRANVPIEINFLPETVMPDATRTDIIAIYTQYGVPVEIKGQWHKNVWDAASVQLIEKYARDWRADDRGIYLVLWFGEVPGKNLPKHPEGLARPTSPNELREMLLARLPSTEQARIDVLVLDVSKPAVVMFAPLGHSQSR
jgi:hypothetical protein